MLGEREMTSFEIKLGEKMNKIQEAISSKKALPPSPLEIYLDNYQISKIKVNENHIYNDNFLRSKKNFQFVMSSLKHNKELIAECKLVSSGSLFILNGNKNLGRNSEIAAKENYLITESELYDKEEKIDEKKAKLFLKTFPNEKKDVINKIKTNIQKPTLSSDHLNINKPIDFPKQSFNFTKFETNIDPSMFFKHLKTKDTIMRNTLKLNLGKNYGNLFLEEPQPNILKKISRKKGELNSDQKIHVERIQSAKNLDRNERSKRIKESETKDFSSKIKGLSLETKFPKWFIEREDVMKKIKSPEFDVKLKMIRIYEKP